MRADQATPEELHEALIRTVIKKYGPYKIFKPCDRYLIAYQCPNTTRRDIIMEDLDKQTAHDLKALLDRAWALGRTSK